MAENCAKDCSSCKADCQSRRQIFLEPQHELSDIKKVYAIISGKGGVGKSLVTALLAVEMNRRGHKTAILDADITGPSIPKMFGISQKAGKDSAGIMPVRSTEGIEIMSVNLLLKDENEPVVWRGPILARTVKQFWTDVIWGDVDYMFIDMPPGTGDVPLTVFQSIPLDGIIVVTSPQDLAGMIVSKAVKMANMLQIKIVGIIENMSYAICPHCGEKYALFGTGKTEIMAERFGLPIIARLPINPSYAQMADAGEICGSKSDEISSAADMVQKYN